MIRPPPTSANAPGRSPWTIHVQIGLNTAHQQQRGRFEARHLAQRPRQQYVGESDLENPEIEQNRHIDRSRRGRPASPLAGRRRTRSELPAITVAAAGVVVRGTLAHPAESGERQSPRRTGHRRRSDCRRPGSGAVLSDCCLRTEKQQDRARCDRRDHREIHLPDRLAQHQRPEQKQVQRRGRLQEDGVGRGGRFRSPARTGSALPRRRGRSARCASVHPAPARPASTDRAPPPRFPSGNPATAQLESEQALIAAPPVENRIAAANRPRPVPGAFDNLQSNPAAPATI